MQLYFTQYVYKDNVGNIRVEDLDMNLLIK